jgi:hypothetical protein
MRERDVEPARRWIGFEHGQRLAQPCIGFHVLSALAQAGAERNPENRQIDVVRRQPFGRYRDGPLKVGERFVDVRAAGLQVRPEVNPAQAAWNESSP